MPSPIGAAAAAAKLIARKIAKDKAKKVNQNSVRAMVNASQKAKPLANPKSGVKVKPAAKQQPGKKNINTFIKKRAVRNAQINEAQKGDDFINSGIRQPGPFSDGKTKLMRQIKASNKKKSK